MIRRLAVIGDIHAEDERLAAALRIAEASGVDLIACTGDVVDGHGSAERCCSLLREHDVACVRGNHDRWLFTGIMRDLPKATRIEQLTPASQTFLRELPAWRDLETPAGRVLLCHGVGGFDLETVTAYHTDYALKNNERLQRVIAGGYRVMLAGHSHERLHLDVGRLKVLNAGALCQPESAGVLVLDFAGNLLQWVSLEGTQIEEREI